MPRRLAVLGHPVAHSLSPIMQTAAFEALGIAGEWSYEAIDVAPEDFAGRVAALPAEGFAGVNVTVPHKLAALGLADRAGAAAAAIGAANVLVFDGEGIGAENTDAAGFLAALPGDPSGARALVLGAGGSARAVVWALVDRGAEVSVWNRTGARADELTDELGGTPIDAEQAARGDFELIVNCTTAGLPGSGVELGDLPLDPNRFRPGQTVVDLVYGDAETELVGAARRAGAELVDGREILVRQGAASLEIWTGLEPPLEAMRAAVNAA
ncbi:MAG: shikimate dehydrogenase [Solirubrobacterales bacterium]|jgi:shikimate dehydrogenase|nr:shikimate dehydrogenase [Solirubrobacterales bacterium]MDX6663779.1 shikimate dehydrogenase [Solirubrobacterales bacterium]